MEGPFNMNPVDFLRDVPMYHAQKQSNSNWLRSDWPFHSSLIFKDSSHWIFIFRLAHLCPAGRLNFYCQLAKPPSTSPFQIFTHQMWCIPSHRFLTFPTGSRPPTEHTEGEFGPGHGPKVGVGPMGFHHVFFFMRVSFPVLGGCFLVGYVLYYMYLGFNSDLFRHLDVNKLLNLFLLLL